MNGAQSRALGASAALVVLVTLPAVIPGAQPDEPQAKPAEGALVAELTGDEGVGEPYILRTQAPSKPPKRLAKLHDAAGTVTATVTPIKSPCDATKPRTAFSEGVIPWCLKVEGTENGAEVSGVLQSEHGDKLSLTVRSRAAFVPGPCLVLLFGLLIGLAVLVFQPWLRSRVREIVLARMVRRNDAKDAATRIGGLGAWVRERLAAGATVESLIAAVERVAASGPNRGDSARKRLEAQIAAVPELDAFELVSSAKPLAEAPNEIGDFYASDGTELDEHPADAMVEAIGQLAALAKALDELDAVLAKIDDESRAGPAAVVSLTREALKQARTAVELAPFEERVARVRGKVEEALIAAAKPPTGPQRAARRAAVSALLPTLKPWQRGPRIALQLDPGAKERLRTVRAMALTVFVVVVTLTYAFVSIKHAAYDGKPLFAGFGDNLALFSAALGSGAAATVLALMSDWRPTADAATSP